MIIQKSSCYHKKQTALWLLIIFVSAILSAQTMEKKLPKKMGMPNVRLESTLNPETGQMEPSTKVVHTYDDMDNKIRTSNYKWDASKKNWTPYQREEYAYDRNGLDSICANFIWIPELTCWLPQSRSEYISIDKDKYKQIIEYTINQEAKLKPIPEELLKIFRNEALQFSGVKTTLLVPYSKIRNKFNSQSKEIENELYKWDKEKGEWLITRSQEFGFAEDGTTLFKRTSDFDEEQNKLVVSLLDSCVYDTNSNKTLQIIKIFDTEAKEFFIRSRTDITYTNDGYISIMKTGNSAGSTVLSQKEHIFLDENNAEVKDFYYWSDQLQKWINNKRETTIFDSTELTRTTMHQFVNGKNQRIILEQKEVNYYNKKNENIARHLYERVNPQSRWELMVTNKFYYMDGRQYTWLEKNLKNLNFSSYKKEKKYTLNGRLKEEVHYKWINVLGEWQPEKKYKIHYLRHQRRNYIMDKSTNKWVLNSISSFQNTKRLTSAGNKFGCSLFPIY